MDNKTLTKKIKQLTRMDYWDSSETHLVTLGYFNMWGGSRKAMTNEQAHLYDEVAAEIEARSIIGENLTPAQLRMWWN